LARLRMGKRNAGPRCEPGVRGRQSRDRAAAEPFKYTNAHANCRKSGRPGKPASKNRQIPVIPRFGRQCSRAGCHCWLVQQCQGLPLSPPFPVCHALVRAGMRGSRGLSPRPLPRDVFPSLPQRGCIPKPRVVRLGEPPWVNRSQKIVNAEGVAHRRLCNAGCRLLSPGPHKDALRFFKD
jgi:hypothetical protein